VQVHVQQPQTPLPASVAASVAATVVAPQSKPQAQTVKPPPASMRPLKISEIRKSISALSPEPAEPRNRRSGLMAREARVLGGDTKDFVDFIRSCTPTSDDQIQPAALANRWSAGATMGTTRSSRSNMVPREPDVRNGPSGDLIDFLRSGPPEGPNEASSGTNGQSSHTILSHPTGADSNTSAAPLVNKNKPLPTNPKAKGPAMSPQTPQVTRKTRRNKDPYAIDSDDEDDEFTALPNNSVRTNGVPQSENLQDFLRSTSPGPSRLNGIANGVSSPQNGTRSASGTGSRPTQATSSMQSQSATMPSRIANQIAPGNGSLSAREPQKATGGSFFSRKKYEARPAGATRGFGGHGFHYSTSDLADYLRSSGPKGASMNGNAMNGGPVSSVPATARESYNTGRMSGSGRNTPSGSIGLNRGDSSRRRIFGRKQVEV
jgi:hypothetical protein